MDDSKRITYNADLDSIINPLFNSELGACPYIIPSRKASKFYDLQCKHFADFSSIHIDLTQALSIIEEFQSKSLRRKKHKIIRETLWKYAVILLGRTFTIGKNRNVNLQKQNFSTLPDSLKLTLDYILHLRHNLIAHQGENEEEYHDTFLILRPGKTKQIAGIEYIKLNVIEPSEKQVSLFKELLIYLIDWTENKIEKLKLKILNKFSDVDIEDIYSEIEI